MCGLADWPEQYRACQPPISRACSRFSAIGSAKLFSNDLSCSQRARFVLNAEGIPFEEIKLDLLAGRAQEVHRSFLTIPLPLLPNHPPADGNIFIIHGT